MERTNLQFLKLGGSLITEKEQPHTPRLDVLERLAGEIARARAADERLQLVLGHGSGSFGHVPARRWGTRQGVRTPQQWLGFVEVWRQANALNRLVVDALAGAELPALSISPLASALAQDGALLRWDTAPIERALTAGLIPVIQGDVVFDVECGGTVLSTEDLFGPLAKRLMPGRILLAGIEPGVWADFPRCTHRIEQITPQSFPQVQALLHGSAAPDVTGGMESKVRQSLEWVQAVPGLEVWILSALEPGSLEVALGGAPRGTQICA